MNKLSELANLLKVRENSLNQAYDYIANVSIKQCRILDNNTFDYGFNIFELLVSHTYFWHGIS